MTASTKKTSGGVLHKPRKVIDRVPNSVWMGAGIAVFAVVGTILLVSSRAATPTASFEAEAGTRSGNVALVSDSGASGTLAVKFGNTGGACTVATQHVPDGPDGMGGCWPGPSNTGPNAPESNMAAYTGSCTVNTANVTIDSKVVNCSVLYVGANASGLMIKNSYLKGGVIQNSGSASFTIQDSILDNNVSRPACSGATSCAAGLYACGDLNNGTVNCGVQGSNFTILRSEIMHTNRGAYCESTCTIQDSYFHGTNLWPDQTNKVHASGIRMEQYLTLRHTTFGCDYSGPYPNSSMGCSADLTGYPDFTQIKNNTIDSNLLLANTGNGFCAYGGATAGKPYSDDVTNATNIVFQNNIFQRGSTGQCGQYGPILDYVGGRTGNIWANNKYDNGTTVPPN